MYPEAYDGVVHRWDLDEALGINIMLFWGSYDFALPTRIRVVTVISALVLLSVRGCQATLTLDTMILALPCILQTVVELRLVSKCVPQARNFSI
jgi:hypothetical protein